MVIDLVKDPLSTKLLKVAPPSYTATNVEALHVYTVTVPSIITALTSSDSPVTHQFVVQVAD